MNYLQQLLKDQKVEWKKLGEVCRIKNGRDYKHLGEGNIPVYGSGGIMRYVDTFVYDKPTVLIPRKGSLHNLFYVDTPFWNVDTIFYTEIDTNQILPKFLYHFLTTQNLEKLNMAGGVPSLTQTVLNKLPIPLPPLSVQSRIVEILDKFTALEAELEAELELRKKQYQHYREQLLNFSSTPPHEFNVIWRKLGEVCGVLRGRRLTKKELSQEKQGFAVYHGGIEPIGYYPTANRKANSTMVINVGASAGTVGFSREKFWSSDGCFCFTESPILLQRFLFYYLQSIEHKVKSKVRVAGIPTLDANILYNLDIPLPPLSVQSRIVEILDKFDTLTNSITEGLPLEIKLRRQQYEYYREQLLNFPHH